MDYLDLDAIAATPLSPEPFPHLLARDVIPAPARAAVARDYPAISQPGSFALADLAPGAAVRGLIENLAGEDFRRLMEQRFDVDLEGRPTVFTLRGHCSARDGAIHTDSKSKILSLLLYLNDGWAPEGGRLRLLKPGADLGSATVEIAPEFGALLAFKRSDYSWHGHLPYAGPRRVLQMNYVRSARTPVISDIRHRLSAVLKRALSHAA